MRLVLMVMFVCSACTSGDVPVVYVTGDAREAGLLGVQTWSELGFVGTLDDPGLPECDRTWYSDWFESMCQITLDVRFVDRLSDDDVGGEEVLGKVDFETRVVLINTSEKGDALTHVMAHEVGHILLDAMHLESYLEQEGYVGIMSWMPTWLLEPTEDDFELACRSIGVCIN